MKIPASSNRFLGYVTILSVFGFICTLLVSSLSIAAEDLPQWPMFKYNNNHTGIINVAGPTIPEIKWSYGVYNPNVAVDSSLAISSDGKIYFGRTNGGLVTLNNNGTLNSIFSQYTVSVESTPAIDNEGNIYFVGETTEGYKKVYRVYALSKDNILKWSYIVPVKIKSSPTIGIDGKIYFGGYDNKVYVFDKNGYQSEFVTDTEAKGILGSAAITEAGTVYVGANKLFSIDPLTKTIKWTFDPTPNDPTDRMDSSPSIGTDGTIFIGSNNRSFYAVKPDGTLKWSYQTGGAIYSDPSIATDGTVYVGSLDHKLYAFSPSISTPKWAYDTGSMIIAGPIIDRNGVVYITSGTKLFAINPKGTLKWSYDLKVTVTTTPIMDSQGNIYIYTDNDQIFCIENGKKPTTPANVKVILQTGYKLRISWNPSIDNKYGIRYAVYRSLSKYGNYTKIAEVGYGTYYIDTSVKKGYTYYYYLKAEDADGYFSSNSSIIKGDLKAPIISRASLSETTFNTKKKKYISLGYVVDEQAYVNINIYNSKGKLVSTLAKNKIFYGGKASVKWYGKDAKGKSLAAGRYTYVITAKDLAGNLSLTKKGTITKK